MFLCKFFYFFLLLLGLNKGLSAQQWQPLGQIYQDTNCNYKEELKIQLIQEGKMLVRSQTFSSNLSIGKHQVHWLVQEAGQWQEQKTVVINNIAPKEQAQSLFSEDGEYWVLLRTVLLYNKIRNEHKLCIQLQRFKWNGTAWDLQASQTDTLVNLGWVLDMPSHHSTLQLSKEGKEVLLYHTINTYDGQEKLLQTYHWENNHWNKKLELKEVHEPQLSSNGKTIALLKIEDMESIRNTWVVTYYQQDNKWQLVEQELAKVQGSGYGHDRLIPYDEKRIIKLSANGKNLAIGYIPDPKAGGYASPQLKIYQFTKREDKAYWRPKGQFNALALVPKYHISPTSIVHKQWKGALQLSTNGNQLVLIQAIDSFKRQVSMNRLLYYNWQGNTWEVFKKPLEWPSALYQRSNQIIAPERYQVYFREKGQQLTIHSFSASWKRDSIYNRSIICRKHTLNNYAWSPSPPSFGNSTLTACQEYQTARGQIIRESGIYQDTLVNHLGGDSIITLDLTLVKVDTDLYTVENMIVSLDTTAQIQWVAKQQDSLPFDGQQHYFIPPQTGHYRAEISKEGCVLSSKTIFYQKEEEGIRNLFFLFRG